MLPETLNAHSRSITILCPLRIEYDALVASPIASDAEIVCAGPGFDAVIYAAEAVRIRDEAEGLAIDARAPIILVGLAGALNAKCAAGTAWVAHCVRDSRGRSWSTSWPTTDDPGVVGLQMVDVLGADQYFHGVTEKSEAARELATDLANTEAQALAEWAVTEGYQFGLVQGVRESSDDALPVGFEEWTRADGTVNRRRMQFEALRHPGRIGWMRHTERNERLALAQVIRLLVCLGLGTS